MDYFQMATFNADIGGVVTAVDYTISYNNAAEAHFNYLGNDYNFKITRWQQKAFSAFRGKFHLVYQDTSKYGSSEYDDFWDVVSSDSTAEQNKRIVLQAVKDVFLHLNSILVQQPRSILDYAVWYREKYGTDITTYSKYIQLVTVNCIVHSDFLAGNMKLEVIVFNPIINE